MCSFLFFGSFLEGNICIREGKLGPREGRDLVSLRKKMFWGRKNIF